MKWKIEIEFKVDTSWIDDGFDLKNCVEVIKEMFKNLLPFAHDWETEVIIVEIKEIAEESEKVICPICLEENYCIHCDN